MSNVTKYTADYWDVYRANHFVPFVSYKNGWWNAKAKGHGSLAWNADDKRYADSRNHASDVLLAWFEGFKQAGFNFEGQD